MARFEVDALTDQLQAVRTQQLTEAWGDHVDPSGPYGDTPGFGWLSRRLGYFTQGSDRTEGRYAPVYDHELDLKAIRMAAWLMDEEVPVAKAMKNRLVDYTIGSGFDWEVTHPSPRVQAICRRIVSSFMDNSDWTTLERESFKREIVDGEFIAEFVADGPDISMEVREGDHLTEPANSYELEDWKGYTFETCWSFGILTRKGRAAPIAYHVNRDGVGQDWDLIDADRFVHWKRNAPRNAKRGFSDHYTTHKWLKYGADVLGRTAQGTAVQASIAYIVEHAKGTTPKQAQAIASGRNIVVEKDYQTGQYVNKRKIGAGEVIDIPEGAKYHAGLLGSNASMIYIDVMEALFRLSGVVYAFPEHFVTGFAGNNNRACHSEDTEVLTRSGWIPIAEMSYSTEVATYNLESGHLEYQRPYAIHKYMHSGEMLHFKQRDVDMLITTNHKLIVSDHIYATVEGRPIRTEEIKPWELHRADSLPRRLSAMPFSVNVLEGKKADKFWSLPKLSRTLHRRTYANGDSFRERKLHQKAWLRFIGWFVTEGWVTSQPNGSYVIGISQNEGPDANRIRKVLGALPFAWREILKHAKGTTCKDGYVTNADNLNWYSGDRGLALWLIENCGKGSRHKKLPEFVWGLPYEYKSVLLDAMIRGDGTHLKNGSMLFFSTSKQLIDDAQRLAFECGYVAQIRQPLKTGIMSLSIRDQKKQCVGYARKRVMKLDARAVTKIGYEGFVYCASVENRTMVTRRNGTIAITGNSAEEASSPFIQGRFADQGVRKQQMRRLLLNVIKFGLERLPRLGITFEDIEHELNVSIAEPEIVTKDPAALTTALKMQKEAGWISDRMAVNQLGYDFEDVQQQRKEEAGVQPGQQPDSPADQSMAGLSRRQFMNNKKAILDIVRELKAGEIDQGQATVMLAALGLSKGLVDQLLGVQAVTEEWLQEARDADGDGLVFDGTKQERAVTPEEKAKSNRKTKGSKKPAGPRSVRPAREPKPKTKTALAKASAKYVGKEVQDIGKANEYELAKQLRGEALPNSAPHDVETDDAFVEVKTIVIGENAKLTMNKYAQVLKVRLEKSSKKPFHTVVFDDSVFVRTKNPADRRMYYRRGVAGSARLSSLLRVDGGVPQLKKLMAMPDAKLPLAARRTDRGLFVGTWKPIKGERGFVNSKTGEVAKPKK